MPTSDIQILVIGWVWPEPKSSAAGSHMLSLLRLLQKLGKITFASTAKTTELTFDLESIDIDCQEVSLNDSSFDDFIAKLQPSLVLFDRFMMEEQFGWRVAAQCPNAIRLLDTEDLQCLRDARHKAQKAGREVDASDFHSDLCKREIASIYRSDLSLIISKHEYHWLQQQYRMPKQLLCHLPFMLEAKAATHPQHSFEQRQHFISIGNFRHAPNWDAVLYLKQLWPQIRQQLPKAELHIYGAYLPPKAQALHKPEQGFCIKGWAEDALEVMGQARVCLAPLRFGAGLKGKLLDAMQTATPSITSSVGAEGMAAAADWPGRVCDDDSEFVDAAVQLYRDQAQWTAASEQSQLVLQSFTSDEQAQKLLQCLQLWLEPTQLAQHRQGNFIGAMLTHHHHKSTQYMSQWIEAKSQLEKLQNAQNSDVDD